jgi:hypothetical protein
MGDIADMMMDGSRCNCCGVYLQDANGYPRWCKDCGGDDFSIPKKKKPKKKKKNHPSKDAAK